MNYVQPAEPTLPREVLWESPCGLYAVVRGPFPEGFVRTLTCASMVEAIARKTTGSRGLMPRPETTKPALAKVLRHTIIEAANAWGEYGP